MNDLCYLGLDIGTSSVKGVVMDADGKVVQTATAPCTFSTPRPLWSESDPEGWWSATVAVCRQVVGTVGADRISSLGLSGQMHGLVMLDQACRVLRPCILWNDQRTAAECAELTARVGADRVIRLTGNPVLPGFTAPKLLWVGKHEPEVFSRLAHLLLPKDYVRFRLARALSTDLSDASGTSLLDVPRRRWSGEMVEACGLRSSVLPELHESPDLSCALTPEAASLTGLRAGTPIVAGAGDQAAQAVGCGIVREGLVSATLGTSGVVFAHSESCRVEAAGRLHAFCHAVPGKWHLMGVMLSAAGSYQWLRQALGGDVPYATLDAEAAAVPAGSEGLIFLPYLSGERTPHPDPQARGAWVGLTLRHGRGHLARAVLEGVAFGMRDSLELMRALGIHPGSVIASGGGAVSPLWRQIQADIYGCPVRTVSVAEGAAYGAAILAAVGAQRFRSVEEACQRCVGEGKDQTLPSAEEGFYERFYPQFRALYPVLREPFARLTESALEGSPSQGGSAN